MSIELAQPPAANAEVLSRGLNDVWPTTKAARIYGIDATLNASRPIPIFVAGLSEAAKEDWPNLAKHAGWRYLIMVQETAGVADLSFDSPLEGPRFASFAEGDVVRALQAALHSASDMLSRTDQNYGLRIIAIPPLYAEAVWLVGPEQTFIPYIDGVLIMADKYRTRGDYISYIVNKARRKLESSEALPR